MSDSSNKDSIKTVCEKIWSLESSRDLFNLRIQNVPIWPLIRMSMYYRICTQTGIFSTPHSERVTVRDALAFAQNSIRAPFRPAHRNTAQKKYLVFDHPRKVRVNDEYQDIYTSALLQTLPAEETEVYENWYSGHHLMPNTGNRNVLDDLAVGAAFAQLRPVRFTPEERQRISTIENDLKEAFGQSFPLKKKIAREIRHHKFCVRYFTRLLTKKKPERIFLVVSYSWYKRALITAAKKLGIESVELQHGTFSPYHLGYNFPQASLTVECFPNRFFSFGDYWNRLARLPISADKITTFGFAHFHTQLANLPKTERDGKRILFISQGVIGKQLAKLCGALALALPDYRIAYKLHPGEYTLWKTDYPALVEASKQPNIEIVDNNNSGLYEEFARATYMIGVFSTAIYEGLALGCKTFVVDLPGVEYMDGLVENKMVIKVQSAENIVDHIQQNTPLKSFDAEYIFKKVSSQ
ncbi:MAG: hypothetical protein JXX29_13015 [Deltaproteobacteria bacterium]|nr:hypothetical protein [Deltaproteobacteria bacterium]MBN2672598.1 hypothetical protein [Deltaproteobacteria bacterium]